MSRLYVIAGIVLALAASGAGLFFYGRHVESVEQERDRLADALAYADEIRRLQGDVDTLADDLEAARAARKPKDRVIIKEVVRYETLPADRRCTLDGAWRLLHDAAATGEPAESARVAAGDAAPVADAAAIGTVAGNYEQCRELREQVIGWQRWWATVKPPPAP